MKKILITGASGNVGCEVLNTLLACDGFNLKILLRKKSANIKLAKKISGQSVEVVFGDIENYNDCIEFVKNGDFLLHIAAVIPPLSEHKPELALRSNIFGTQNLVNAVKKKNPKLKFIYFASYAEYGPRNFKHPWGRVGNPLLPSVFDNYSSTKIKAERSVISSDLDWVSLRLPGVLYDDILFSNISDAIMFHTPWNAPIEWTTSRTIANLVKNILTYETQGKLDKSFWKNIYNIGNGEKARVTGYETIDRGFQLMKKNAKYFFKPNWNPLKNFHCFWLEDSNIINNFFDPADIEIEGFEIFFNHIEKKYWFFKLANPFAFFVKKFAIEPLLKKDNAPMNWIKNNKIDKMKAFYGSVEIAKNLTDKWEEFPLLCENKNPETGAFLDYHKLKEHKNAKNYRLNHGYDETKSNLDLKDLEGAGVFRGGHCLAEKMPTDFYAPVKWMCAEGHEFFLSPYAVLKGGFWCSKCTESPTLEFIEKAKLIPYYAQTLNDF